MLDEENFIREVVIASNPSIKVKSITPYGGIFNSHQSDGFSAQNIFENNAKYIYYGVINASRNIGSVFYNGVLLKSSSFKHPLLFDYISGCFSFVGYRIEIDGKPVKLYAQPIQDNNGGGDNPNGSGDNGNGDDNGNGGGGFTADDIYTFNTLYPNVYDYKGLKNGYIPLANGTLRTMLSSEASPYYLVLQSKFNSNLVAIQYYNEIAVNEPKAEEIQAFNVTLAKLMQCVNNVIANNVYIDGSQEAFNSQYQMYTQGFERFLRFENFTTNFVNFIPYASIELIIGGSYYNDLTGYLMLRGAVNIRISDLKLYTYVQVQDVQWQIDRLQLALVIINTKISELENSTNPENGGGSGGNGGTNQQA